MIQGLHYLYLFPSKEEEEEEEVKKNLTHLATVQLNLHIPGQAMDRSNAIIILKIFKI
jgi:hypothetical protein